MPKWKPRVPFRNVDGRLYRHLDIKLIMGTDVKWKRHTAAPGKGFTLANIREACDEMIEALERKFPGVEFREVQVAPNAFNYIAIEPAPKPPVVIKRPDLQLAGEIYTTPRRPILNDEVKDEEKETGAGSLETAVRPPDMGNTDQDERGPAGSGQEGERPQQHDRRTAVSKGSSAAGTGASETDERDGSRVGS